MLVKDAYFDSLRFQESALAHYIHHLLGEMKISLDDDMSKLDFQQADHQKVREMIQNNVLGIHKIRIYSLKMNQKDFVFIYAASEQEAIQFYTKSFHQTPLNCHEYSLDFQLARGNDVISFRDIRKEYEDLPAIAGYFNKTYS
ncbi:hypothetical protein [Bacillus sp. 7884-1]|uniref:hypothetical protein n=1 Tax=Bacillus sp. 7884-1 TaxID=2021693 RepID=UPI000BA5671E|nr:hypothetical protein [Bacillus sp. 7884-1]PAE44298.1 hypothetical protein CHI06_01865 [Bacillus sp. 7884-1]